MNLWAAKLGHIDLLYVDCAGCEERFFHGMDPALAQRVYRMVLVVHSGQSMDSIERALLQSPRGKAWKVAMRLNVTRDPECASQEAFRGGRLDEVRAKHCYSDTLFGPVVSGGAGLLVLDNALVLELKNSATICLAEVLH